MIVTLRSVGGFTGPAGAEEHIIDDAKLPPDVARRLQTLQAALPVATGPQVFKKSAPQSWDFMHTLTVQNGAKSQVYEFHEDAAPAELKAMFKLVSELAQRDG